MHACLRQSVHQPAMLRNSAGTTLIETMIAMVILSIGLLGLAALQMNGLQDNADAERRTQATIIINDLTERMRANTLGVQAGNYAGINFAGINCTAPPAVYCAARGAYAVTDCNPSQVATFDGYVALCEGAARLPNGSLLVECTDAAGTAIACAAAVHSMITLTYNDSTNTPKTLSTVIRP